MLKCSGMQLTSFGFRQHRSSKVTKPGKMSTLPRTPGLQFHKLLLLGQREGQTPNFLFSGGGALDPIQMITFNYMAQILPAYDVGCLSKEK